jgi:hypothetical protein
MFGPNFVGRVTCADVWEKMAEVKNCLEEVAIMNYTNGHTIIVFGNYELHQLTHYIVFGNINVRG